MLFKKKKSILPISLLLIHNYRFFYIISLYLSDRALVSNGHPPLAKLKGQKFDQHDGLNKLPIMNLFLRYIQILYEQTIVTKRFFLNAHTWLWLNWSIFFVFIDIRYHFGQIWGSRRRNLTLGSYTTFIHFYHIIS